MSIDINLARRRTKFHDNTNQAKKALSFDITFSFCLVWNDSKFCRAISMCINSVHSTLIVDVYKSSKTDHINGTINFATSLFSRVFLNSVSRTLIFELDGSKRNKNNRKLQTSQESRRTFRSALNFSHKLVLNSNYIYITYTKTPLQFPSTNNKLYLYILKSINPTASIIISTSFRKSNPKQKVR